MAFYVTTPIFYVNAAPHLGHAYTSIAADVVARHMRQRGEDVFFLTGTDEHGEPVAVAAEQQGLTPKELADKNAEKFKALIPQLHASNDFFIRTSDAEQGPNHTCLIHEIPLTWEQEENWFFRLSTFQEPLEELLKTDFVQPASRRNEAASFVGQGLQDVSLTRGKIT